jgi:hypothetical protein
MWRQKQAAILMIRLTAALVLRIRLNVAAHFSRNPAFFSHLHRR